jgi:hypothetical protein
MSSPLLSLVPLRLFSILLFLTCVSCSGDISPGITVKLIADQTAPLGGTMLLRAAVMTTFDAPNVEVYFELSSGITAIKGDLRHRIAMLKNKTQVFELQVQLVTAGEQRVGVVATATLEGGGLRGAQDRFYLEVGEHNTVIRQYSLTPTPLSEGMS